MANVLTLFEGSSSATGDAVEILVGRRFAISVGQSGGSVGTTFPQASFDGTNWFPLSPAISGGSTYAEYTALCRFVRVIYSDNGNPGTALVLLLQSDED